MKANKITVLALSVAIAGASITSCSTNDCCNDCDSMRVVLDEYVQRDSMKSQLLRSYDEHLSSFGNIQDSIDICRKSIDSLKTVITGRGKATGAQNAELQKYIAMMKGLIDKNLELAEELKSKGYKNASMDKLIQLLFANVEAKQAELKETQREISMLKSQVKGLETKVENLSSANEALTSEVAALNTKAAKVTGSVKVIQPKERKAKKIKSLDFVFSLNENDKAAKGTITVYFRVVDNTGKVLEPSGEFMYEGKSIAYTAKSSVDYKGENVRNKITWQITSSVLSAGTYTVDFFIDDHKGISDSFTLDK